MGNGEELLAGGVGGFVVVIVQTIWKALQDYLIDRRKQRDQRKNVLGRWYAWCSSFEARGLHEGDEMRGATGELRASYSHKKKVVELCDEMLDHMREGPSDDWNARRDAIRKAIG